MASGGQLEALMRRIPDADESDLENALDDAEDEIFSRRYPFCNRPDSLPDKYKGLQLRVAVALYNKRGAEGESAHSEAGVSRTYESVDDLLRNVTPLGAVL